MREVYDTVFVGASYTAVGYAIRNGKKENLLILESTEFPGAEYHAVFRTAKPGEPTTEEGRRFLDFLTQKGIVRDGKCDTLRLFPALCRYIEINGITDIFRLGADVVSVRREGGLFSLTYITNSGLHTVRARRIIDTTLGRVKRDLPEVGTLEDAFSETVASGKSCRDLPKIPTASGKRTIRKVLNVLAASLSEGAEEAIRRTLPLRSVTPVADTGEVVLSFEFGEKVSLTEARLFIEKGWSEAFGNDKSFPGEKSRPDDRAIPDDKPLIDAVGFDFDVKVETVDVTDAEAVGATLDTAVGANVDTTVEPENKVTGNVTGRSGGIVFGDPHAFSCIMEAFERTPKWENGENECPEGDPEESLPRCEECNPDKHPERCGEGNFEGGKIKSEEGDPEESSEMCEEGGAEKDPETGNSGGMRYYSLCDGEVRSVAVGNVGFSESYDLVVAGLGSAGAFLAISAARDGASVLGIEKGTAPGGMSVRGVVNGYYNGYSGRMVDDIDKEVAEKVGSVYRTIQNHPSAKGNALDRRLSRHGVDVRYRHRVIGVYVREISGGKKVVGVRIYGNGVVSDVACTFLSDSTGDGHVLRMLGIPGSYGRPTDGKTVPFSSVRVYRRRDGKLIRTNDDSGYLDPYDDIAFSHSVIVAHGKHLKDTEKKRDDTFLYCAPLIGNREGMLIDAEENVTLSDVLDEKKREKPLLCVYSDIDKHGSDRAFDGELYQDWFVISNLSTVTFKIQLPLGAIVPRGYRGLLSVSRCLGADSYASSAIRMNRDMHRLGEAAGIAVALALKHGTDSVCDVPFEDIRASVALRDCYERASGRTKGFVDSAAEVKYVPVEWMTEPKEIIAALGTDTPGVAIWSARRLGAEKIGDTLEERLFDPDERTRYNSAVALGLLGDERAIPVLRETVEKRRAYFYLDCRRTNQLRSVIAICLLGRFADGEITDELCSMFSDEEYEKEMYHTYKERSYKLSVVPGFDNIYYQHLSFAAVALRRITEKHPERLGKVRKVFAEAFSDERILKRITTYPEGSTYRTLAKELREYALGI